MINSLLASGSSRLIVLDCADTIDAELTQVYETAYLTPRNLLYPVVISVSGSGAPQIMINDSNVWVTAGTIFNGQRIKVRSYSSPLYSTSVITTITIHTTTFTWKLKTRKAQITPNPIVLQPQLELELNTIVYSNYVSVSGFEIDVPISIIGDNNPTYSINNGPYVSSGTIRSGQSLRIKTNSANHYSALTKCILTISNSSFNFAVKTRNKINKPISFEFTDLQNVGLSSGFTSDLVIPTGYDDNLSIIISNGEYCINNDGLWKSDPGVLIPGQSIKLRTISQSSNGQIKIVQLLLGDFNTSWAVTTGILTANPDPFSFEKFENININVDVISDTILITGIEPNTSISTSSHNLKYLKSNTNDYTYFPGTVNVGDTITVKENSGLVYNDQVINYLTVGGFSTRFIVNTKYPNHIPGVLIFNTQINVQPAIFIYSNPVTILNIDSPVSIYSFGSGSSEFSINNGPWVTSATIFNNDVLVVRLVSSDFPLTKLTASIIINNSVFEFTIITRDQKITPNSFDFIPNTNVPLQSQIESNTIIISGIDAPAPISVVGGMYKVNNFSYTYSNGLINNGDRLKLITTTASTTNTISSVFVSVGELIREFKTTTVIDIIPNDIVLIPKDLDIFAFSIIESSRVRLLGFDDILNIYIQNPTPGMNIEISVTNDENSIDVWLPVINSTTPISSIKSGQYLTIRGVSGNYSTSQINSTIRSAIVRLAPTSTTGMAIMYNIPTSRLALSGDIQGNPTYITVEDARSDVYYYSELLLMKCIGDMNIHPTALDRLFFRLESSRDYPADSVQISLDGGVSWETNNIAYGDPFGTYVDTAQQIKVRCKIPVDYRNYIDHANNGTAIYLTAKAWNVNSSEITLHAPVSQLLVISIPAF